MKIWNLFKREKRQVEHKIFSCSIHDDVKILGQVFHGLQDIEAHVEMVKYEGIGREPWEYKAEKTGQVHVGEMLMRYPCFDSSDYAYENRSYQNYILRDSPITPSDMRRLEQLPAYMDAKRIDASVPEDMLPMVYYVGDGDTMIIAI